jgi:mono/diheme cytochrome c family protein
VKNAPALIAQILVGMEEHGMPPFRDALNDRQIAAISTYVRNTWGNTFGIVTPAEVAAQR